MRLHQLRRKEDEELSPKARIAAQAGVLRSVPERDAVLSPGHVEAVREIRRQDDLFIGNVTAAGVIMDLAGALVPNALARATT
jgi:hypothetical protein